MKAVLYLFGFLRELEVVDDTMTIEIPTDVIIKDFTVGEDSTVFKHWIFERTEEVINDHVVFKIKKIKEVSSGKLPPWSGGHGHGLIQQ